MACNRQRLVILVLFTTCLAFSAAQKTKREILEKKTQQLRDLSSRRPVIKLDNEKFKYLARTSPRNYSLAIMFTALRSQRGCAVCSQANEEWNILAQSWLYTASADNRVFFGVVDFDEATEAFQSMKLSSAPVFIMFPSKGSPKKADTLDIHRTGFEAEVLSKWVNEKTDVTIRVMRPPNYVMTFVLALTVLVVGGLAYIKRDSLDQLLSRSLWGTIVIGFILVMMSGQMWNQIRGPPFAHRDQKTGSMSYIHGSSQGQFIAETYIIMMLHGAVTMGMIMLNEVPGSGDTKAKVAKGAEKVVVVIGLVILSFFFSVLLMIFRGKYPGYPYKFLL